MQIYRHGNDNGHKGRDYQCISPDVKSHRNVIKKVQNYFIKLDDVLGKGSFSTVYRAVEEKTEEVVAVKVIELNKIQSPTLLELLYSEIDILKSIRHPNILQCYEVFFSANNCYIVTEYCNEGDVRSLVAKSGPLSQKAASKIVLGVFEGLKYLSREHIVHRDLKTANVFMKNGKPKIADFGFAKRTKQFVFLFRQSFKDINIGSPVCMSPEGIIHNIYGPKSDVWAFGIFLYQIFHGNNLFGFCRNEDDLREAVVKQVKPQGFYHNLSTDLKELIVSCLQVNQQKRASIQNLEYDTYIRKLHQSNKSSNILVSQVQEYTTKTYDSMASTEVQYATQRRSIFPNRPVDVLVQEGKNTTSKLNLETNDAIKSERYIRSNKHTSFDIKVSSPKESGKFVKKELLQVPESRIRGDKTSKESDLQHRNSMNLGDKKCLPASLKKDVRNQTSVILNYKSASTFQRTQKDRVQRQGLPPDMEFDDLLALLHYCRMLYKTIKSVSQYAKGEIDILSSWLFFILVKIKSSIGGPESSSQFKKLKQILTDYTVKYKKELFLNVEVQADHQKMQRMLLKTLNDLEYGSKDKDQAKTRAIRYAKFLYDLNQMLGQAMSKGKYRGFTERNGVEEFLNNMQEGLIYRPRRTNYNFQK